MADPVSLTQIEKDAHRTFNQDGLMYLFMGVLLAAVGLSFYDTRFGFLGGLVALLIFPFELFRRRITYPRVGYARFKPPDGFGRGILGFMVAAIAVLTFFAFFDNGRLAKYLPFIISIVMGLSFFFGASMQGLRLRDWAVIGLMIVSGVIAMVVFDDWHTAVAVQFWFIAVLLIIIGTVDLIRFLHKYPTTVTQGDI
ncbi:MAG: hypothetical protein GY796_03420 [Chloroflexi bacterium]|nr:hypothetical protein [Chloroflexota bacterium]